MDPQRTVGSDWGMLGIPGRIVLDAEENLVRAQPLLRGG